MSLLTLLPMILQILKSIPTVINIIHSFILLFKETKEIHPPGTKITADKMVAHAVNKQVANLNIPATSITTNVVESTINTTTLVTHAPDYKDDTFKEIDKEMDSEAFKRIEEGKAGDPKDE